MVKKEKEIIVLSLFDDKSLKDFEKKINLILKSKSLPKSLKTKEAINQPKNILINYP